MSFYCYCEPSPEALCKRIVDGFTEKGRRVLGQVLKHGHVWTVVDTELGGYLIRSTLRPTKYGWTHEPLVEDDGLGSCRMPVELFVLLGPPIGRESIIWRAHLWSEIGRPLLTRLFDLRNYEGEPTRSPDSPEPGALIPALAAALVMRFLGRHFVPSAVPSPVKLSKIGELTEKHREAMAIDQLLSAIGDELGELGVLFDSDGRPLLLDTGLDVAEVETLTRQAARVAFSVIARAAKEVAVEWVDDEGTLLTDAAAFAVELGVDPADLPAADPAPSADPGVLASASRRGRQSANCRVAVGSEKLIARINRRNGGYGTFVRGSGAHYWYEDSKGRFLMETKMRLEDLAKRYSVVAACEVVEGD